MLARTKQKGGLLGRKREPVRRDPAGLGAFTDNHLICREAEARLYCCWPQLPNAVIPVLSASTVCFSIPFNTRRASSRNVSTRRRANQQAISGRSLSDSKDVASSRGFCLDRLCLSGTTNRILSPITHRRPWPRGYHSSHAIWHSDWREIVARVKAFGWQEYGP